jgi:UDP-3-O-[3-hydroxymyristoyl] glucosamine N-acyltransferase
MRLLVKIFLLGSLLTLVSCSSTPLALKDAKKISLDSDSRYASPSKENTASVIIVRDSGMAGALSEMYVLIDKNRVTTLLTGEYVELFMKPGNYYLGAKNEMTADMVERDILVKENDKLQFQINLSTGLEIVKVNRDAPNL